MSSDELLGPICHLYGFSEIWLVWVINSAWLRIGRSRSRGQKKLAVTVGRRQDGGKVGHNVQAVILAVCVHPSLSE